MGRIFCRVCLMYGCTLDHLLWKLSLDQVIMLYDYGMEFEKTKSIILVNTLAEAMSGIKSVKNIKDDKPDRKEFYKRFGDRIRKIKRS